MEAKQHPHRCGDRERLGFGPSHPLLILAPRHRQWSDTLTLSENASWDTYPPLVAVGGILGASLIIIYFCLQLTGDIFDQIDGDKGWYNVQQSRESCARSPLRLYVPLPASLSAADTAAATTFSNVSRPPTPHHPRVATSLLSPSGCAPPPLCILHQLCAASPPSLPLQRDAAPPFSGLSSVVSLESEH